MASIAATPIVPALKRAEIIEQSNDTSPINTKPVLVKSAVVSIVGGIVTILVVFGRVTMDQGNVLIGTVGNILAAILVLLPIVAGIWGQRSAFSPQAAASTAVVNVDAAFEAGKAGESKPVPVLAVTK